MIFTKEKPSISPQLAFTYSKSKIETQKQYVKSVEC